MYFNLYYIKGIAENRTTVYKPNLLFIIWHWPSREVILLITLKQTLRENTSSVLLPAALNYLFSLNGYGRKPDCLILRSKSVHLHSSSITLLQNQYFATGSKHSRSLDGIVEGIHGSKQDIWLINYFITKRQSHPVPTSLGSEKNNDIIVYLSKVHKYWLMQLFWKHSIYLKYTNHYLFQRVNLFPAESVRSNSNYHINHQVSVC